MFVLKNVSLVEKFALAVLVHRSCRGMHEVPQDVSVPDIYHDEHVIFCLVGVDEGHAVSAVHISNGPVSVSIACRT